MYKSNDHQGRMTSSFLIPPFIAYQWKWVFTKSFFPTWLMMFLATLWRSSYPQTYVHIHMYVCTCIHTRIYKESWMPCTELSWLSFHLQASWPSRFFCIAFAQWRWPVKCTTKHESDILSLFLFFLALIDFQWVFVHFDTYKTSVHVFVRMSVP